MLLIWFVAVQYTGTYNAVRPGEAVQVQVDVDVRVNVRHVDVNVLAGQLLCLHLATTTCTVRKVLADFAVFD